MTDPAPARHDVDMTDGQLNALQPDHWLVPGAVLVDHGYLVPDYQDGTRPTPDAALAHGLAALREADDATVAAFAQRHGMLGLCGHDQGIYHPPRAENEQLPEFDGWPDLLRAQDLFGDYSCRVAAGVRHPKFELVDGSTNEYGLAERADVWRLIANIVQFLLGVATGEDAATHGTAGLDRWLKIEQMLTQLTQDAGVRPYIVRSTSEGSVAESRLVIGGGSLLGGVVVELLYAIAGGGPNLIRCNGCKVWFSPRRQPSGHGRSWCSQCRARHVDDRHYAAEYRRRDRESPERAKLNRGRRVSRPGNL